MADICPVCKEKIGLLSVNWIKIGGLTIHYDCREAFSENPELYGGKATQVQEMEAQINLEKETPERRTQEIKEHQKQQQRIEEKSVYVKGFSMPFGEMVEFMVKWAIASIPAFIILFIIFGIFFAIFGALFF